MSDLLPAPPAPPPEAVAPRPRPRRRLLGALVVVVGVALLGVTIALLASRGGSTEPSSTPSADPSVAIVAPPAGLHASTGPFQVVLRWHAPMDAAPLGYLIYRDGDLLSTERGDTSFVDHDVLPDTAYRYQVAAFDTTIHHSALVSVRATTASAPASSARLAGVFNVKLEKTSSYGVNGMATKQTAGWRFTPKCAVDPCDVAWVDIHWKELGATLQRTGGRYEGSTSIRGYLECSGTQSMSSIHLTLRVMKAHGVGGEWRATSLGGTMTVDNVAQLGCQASHLGYSLTATLAR